MMRRTVQALTAALLLTATLPTQAVTLAEVKARGTLTVSLYKEFPPYSYLEKGQQKGVDVDIAKALAERLGVTSHIRLVGADENVEDDLRNNVWKGHYLGSGITDVMLHMPYDRAFSRKVNEVRFVAPYHLEQLVFAFDTNKVGERPTIANFMHDPIGVELDTLSDFYLLQAMGGAIGKKLRHFRSNSEAAEALLKGEIAGIMGPRGELEGVLATRPSNIQISRLVTPGLARGSWALGVAVKADIHGDLRKVMNQTMAELVEDGTIQKIFESHKLTYQPPAKP